PRSTIFPSTTLFRSYRETVGPWAQVTAENDRDRERTHGALKGAQAALSRDGDNTSNYIRLSALTRLAIQKTKNTEVKSLEASTRSEEHTSELQSREN